MDKAECSLANFSLSNRITPTQCDPRADLATYSPRAHTKLFVHGAREILQPIQQFGTSIFQYRDVNIKTYL